MTNEEHQKLSFLANGVSNLMQQSGLELETAAWAVGCACQAYLLNLPDDEQDVVGLIGHLIMGATAPYQRVETPECFNKSH